jgi:hypothetical protein
MTDDSKPSDLLAISEEQIIKELAIPSDTLAKFDAVMLEKDYSKLTKEERSIFVRMQCRRAGLAPDLNPIEFINTDGKLRPYMNKGCAEQLRAIHNLDAPITEKQIINGFWVVQVRVADRNGRHEDEVGTSSASDPQGLKKAVTQAKRRGTLAFCGMGALDVAADDDNGNGHSNGPARFSPPPVDPGSRFPQATPQPSIAPTISRPQPSAATAGPKALPDPSKGGVVPPVAIPAVARPKR